MGKTALLVYGTRPEAIKMAPLIPSLRAVGIEPIVAVTGQHREMLDQVNELFAIVPAYDLDISKPRQTLAHITATVVDRLSAILESARPDVIIVQGDTSSTFAGGLAAFYQQIPVVHVEAGLRTGKRYSPFPEEINRRLTTQVASLHLAPTRMNAENLLAEQIPVEDIAVTGNTVIDSLLEISAREVNQEDERVAQAIASGRRIVLMTTHRRESLGARMQESMSALRKLADQWADDLFVLPLHRNPAVREVVEPAFAGADNVILTEPLEYSQFASLLRASHLVITDSGGVQEEAPGLGKPVLVMRDDTERPEAVHAGTVKLVGTDGARIFEEASRLLCDESAYAEMSNAVNPYGDGAAGARSAAAIAQMLGVGTRLPDFDPTMP
ncbi:MAG: UDP-N-acetylglucosamine 2-epimerase (non-hydrolyzing) [Nocardioides sp.]